MGNWPEAFTTEGTIVRLEPLAPAHAPDLQEVVAKSQLHKLWYTMIPALIRCWQRLNGAMICALAAACCPCGDR